MGKKNKGGSNKSDASNREPAPRQTNSNERQNTQTQNQPRAKGN